MTENKEEIMKMSPHDFYFEASLYQPVKINELESDILKWEIDGYNSISHFETTFKIDSDYRIHIEYNHIYPLRGSMTSPYHWYIFVNLICKRDINDEIIFLLHVNGDAIVKVWQYPSLADIQFAELGKKYNKVLPEEDLRDFKKAIGLYAHDAWAWSFVYLRRIFERLIYSTYEEHKSELWLLEEDFQNKRMAEKVEVLEHFLPEQLVEMKVIYWILSKWVHELSEQECKIYFSPMKLSIELILDEKIEMQAKKDKDKRAKAEIIRIHQELVAGRDKE